LGGHCIPIDPFYLTWKAREFDYHTKLIETAGEINTAMPEYTVSRMAQILNDRGQALKGAKVFLLGVAYKQDIDDLRESPVLKVIEHLEANGASVSYNDKFILSFEHNQNKYKSIDITPENLAMADIVAITTAHSYYDKELIIKSAKVVFDTKNVLKVKADNVIKL
jgi:UDP-N-acetyl-D-glucosamine dehydrogenase